MYVEFTFHRRLRRSCVEEWNKESSKIPPTVDMWEHVETASPINQCAPILPVCDHTRSRAGPRCRKQRSLSVMLYSGVIDAVPSEFLFAQRAVNAAERSQKCVSSRTWTNQGIISTFLPFVLTFEQRWLLPNFPHDSAESHASKTCGVELCQMFFSVYSRMRCWM